MCKEATGAQTTTRDINNVIGNQYIFNNSIIEIAGADGRFKLDDVELKIKKLEKVDYLSQLSEHCNQRKLVARDRIVEELNELINSECQIILYGEPGIGKTVLLNELSKDKEAVYISIKDKSAERVIKYLIKSIEVDYNYGENSDIIDVLESLLQISGKLFLIDDCESNPDVVKSLLSIEKFRNKFIFASRNVSILGNYNIKTYKIKPFNEKEIESFIKNNIVNMNEFGMQELVECSQGNPLYLYYFSTYQINPLPKGLNEYQQSIWNSVSSNEKELLNCIVTTMFPINFPILMQSYCDIIGQQNTPMQLMETISRIEFLLKINDQTYEIFHPTFKEFLVKQLKGTGLINYYRQIIGNACLANSDSIEATILLLGLENEKVKDYLIETSNFLYLTGFIQLSAKVLNTGLEVFDKEIECFEYGFINYHLSNVYKELNDNKEAYTCIEKAIECFQKCEDKEFYILSLVFQASFLAEDGNTEECLELMNRILESLPDKEIPRAFVYINFSRIYLYFNQYKQGAIYSRKAIELFKKLDDKRGISCGMLNYSSCLANLDEEDLAIEYLEKLFNDDKLMDMPILKAAVLNNLTLCHRRIGNYDKAKSYCLESISICKKLSLYKKIAMNIINLGNIYRDEKNFAECEKRYLKGLSIAEELNDNREIGRANELLANIYNLQKQYEMAIIKANEAINYSKSVEDNFRVAEALIERSIANKGLGNMEEYSNDIDAAINYYLKDNFYDTALYYLFKSCKTNYKLNNLNIVASNIELIKNIANGDDFSIDEFVNQLKNVEVEIEDSEILDLYEAMFNSYIASSNARNIVFQIVDFSIICKKNKTIGKKVFLNVINKLIECCISKSTLLNMLAFAIEQSGDLLNIKELDILAEKIVQLHEGFYFREISDGSIVFTVSWVNGAVIQINAIKSNSEYRVAFALALIILNNSHFFFQQDMKFSMNIMEFFVMDSNTFEEQVKSIPDGYFNEHVSALFLQRNALDVPVVMILHNEYAVMADHSINADNKAFVWILMNVYREVVHQFYNIEPINSAELAKEARLFVERLTGIKNVIDQNEWKLNLD
ncbi:tetratricopeptide repeat protein [Clostridium lundense]|uniref:tetratricopeptide repeat protein n=1 Tax=Clostridium lundense TaxID=319475 RepID=UPI00048746F5|nr:tetratricopeptide repeat protein [Clostridium lundense]